MFCFTTTEISGTHSFPVIIQLRKCALFWQVSVKLSQAVTLCSFGSSLTLCAINFLQLFPFPLFSRRTWQIFSWLLCRWFSLSFGVTQCSLANSSQIYITVSTFCTADDHPSLDHLQGLMSFSESSKPYKRHLCNTSVWDIASHPLTVSSTFCAFL